MVLGLLKNSMSLLNYCCDSKLQECKDANTTEETFCGYTEKSPRTATDSAPYRAMAEDIFLSLNWQEQCQSG